jgi:hypothetical protein
MLAPESPSNGGGSSGPPLDARAEDPWPPDSGAATTRDSDERDHRPASSRIIIACLPRHAYRRTSRRTSTEDRLSSRA